MKFILDSIERAAKAGHAPLALFSALSIPDIASGIDPRISVAPTDPPRYAQWVDEWFITLHPSYRMSRIDGATLYALRCKLLHAGVTAPSLASIATKSSLARKKKFIAFNAGDGSTFHEITSVDGNGDSWTILRAEYFCEEMVAAARNWINSHSENRDFQEKLNNLIDIRMQTPFSNGVPFICGAI